MPVDVVTELVDVVGRQKATSVARRLAEATRAYERDRYAEAMQITRALVRTTPMSSAARELHGLACYRLGRWREAVKHLEAARSLSGGDTSQLPVVMDCHRAMGNHRRVEALWEELRSSSPPADVLVEGRLVMSADLADRGELQRAIEMLLVSGAARNVRHPADRHLRQWYVLADLLERAGEVPRARELFMRVATADPELADAAERVEALGAGRRARPNRAGKLRR